MKNVFSSKLGLVIAAAVLMPIVSTAATVESMEQWNGTSVEGWTCVDSDLISRPSLLSNTNNSLKVSFAKRTVSVAPPYILRADSNASQGRFIGDYASAGAACANFKFLSPNCAPSSAKLYFHSSGSDRYWYLDLPVLDVGTWVQFSVPLYYAAGWKIDYSSFPSKALFETDIQSIDWIGVRLTLNGEAAQSYNLDDFVLVSASTDSDGDGTTDLSEARAGTNPYDSSSIFRLSVAGVGSNGVTISWPSSPFVTYDIWRTTDLAAGFGDVPLATIPGAAGTRATSYPDTTALDEGPYFYRVTTR